MRHLKGGIETAVWLSSFSGLPGCSSLLLLDKQKKIILLKQVDRHGSFHADSFQLSGNRQQAISHAYMCVADSMSIHIVYCQPSSCEYHQIALDILKGCGKEIFVHEYCWDDNLSVFAVDFSNNFPKMRLLGFSPHLKDRVTVGEVDLSNGQVTLSSVLLPSSPRAFNGQGITVESVMNSVSGRALMANIDGFANVWDNLGAFHLFCSTGINYSSSEYCLSSNKMLLLTRSESGALGWSPILCDRDVAFYAMVLFQSSSSLDLFWFFKTSVKDPLPLVANIVANVPQNVKKTHLFATVAKLFDLWPSCRALSNFFHRIWRLCHFWEVAICCTGDILASLKVLESGEWRGGTLSFDPAMLTTLVDLGIEAADHVDCIVGNYYSDQPQVLVVRALEVGIILHRIVSSLIILQLLAGSLCRAAEAYVERGDTAIIARHFGLLHAKLSEALKRLDSDNLIHKLEEKKSLASRPVHDLFSGSMLQSWHESAFAPPRLEAVTGATLVSNRDFCAACWSPLQPKAPGEETFWSFHWIYCCPCGASRFSKV